MQPKYPEIEVNLVGRSGNAFSIIGTVTNALRRAGVNREEISTFQEKATSGDYNNMLTTCMSWVTVL